MRHTSSLTQYLPKATRDVEEALDAVRTVWTADDHDAIKRLALATEALIGATSTILLALAAITIALRDLEKEP